MNGIAISEKKRGEVIDHYSKRLRIKAASPEIEAGSLSGGNQQKVVLGKWLATKPDVLILDEPTRGVDVNAKFEIYTVINELAKEGIAIIMVSSELPEDHQHVRQRMCGQSRKTREEAVKGRALTGRDNEIRCRRYRIIWARQRRIQKQLLY